METPARNGTSADVFPGLRPQAPEQTARIDSSIKPRSAYVTVEPVKLPTERIMGTNISVKNQHRFGELYVIS